MSSRRKLVPSLGVSLVLLGASSSAFSQEAASVSASSASGGALKTDGSSAVLEQAPLELGLFGGMFFPAASHDIYSTTHEAFTSPSLELGGRLAVFPWSFLGLEVEAAGMPSTTKTTDAKAGFWAARGHLIGQAHMGSMALFALAGAGALSAGSTVTGTDTDLTSHFGVGIKLGLDDVLGLRLDLRDTLGQKFQEAKGTFAHHPEILLGFSFGVRKTAAAAAVPPPPPPDADRDQIPDDKDACKDVVGPAPDGCPDSDGDGLMDNKDLCPAEAGSAPCGCPPRDKDHDKVIDELDRCPDEAGPVEGCPDPDTDHDGVSGAADKCPDKPETLNGFEDDDGCPDQIPERVKKFTGVIRGIEFDRDADTIRAVSASTLDNAALVLNEFPSLRVLISGYTDTDGTREHNLDLSARRAASVKAYFVGKGVAGERIETRGAGPDEPIADNKTAAGKQKNRRIEFRLLEGAAAKPPAGNSAATESAPTTSPTGGAPSEGMAK